MLKFKFLRWVLTKLLQRVVKKSPACAKDVEVKDLVFQIQTLGGIGRHFSIRNGKVSSSAGLTSRPKFTMTFRDAATGYGHSFRKGWQRSLSGSPTR